MAVCASTAGIDMTQEALKLALEYIQAVPDDRYNAEHINRDALITAIKEALAQTQEPVAGTKTWLEDGKVITQHLTASDIYKKPDEKEYLSKAYRLANELRCHLAIAPAPQRTEQNFCSRCGKRTKDLTNIHTCTPPQN